MLCGARLSGIQGRGHLHAGYVPIIRKIILYSFVFLSFLIYEYSVHVCTVHIV